MDIKTIKEEKNVKKAYLYGTEVTILDFYLSEHGIQFCKVKINDTGWVNKVPVSCVEIR